MRGHNVGWPSALEVVVARGYWTDPSRPMEVYENNQDGTFTRITNGLARTAGRWVGLTWADFNGDGTLDCFAPQMQPRDPWLFLNQGNGEFSATAVNRNNTANGLNAPGYWSACADYDADGAVDVVMAYAGDTGTPGKTAPTLLLHNLGDARFEVLTNTPLAVWGAYIESFSWVDYDGDGDVDLLAVTSGDDADQLFQNQGNGSFIRIESHPLVDRSGTEIWAGWADYDNDGDWDMFAPYWDAPSGVLYRNRGNGDFDELLDVVELAEAEWPCAPIWGDYDNDGDLDLFVTHAKGPNRFFRNNGDGTFTEIDVGSPNTSVLNWNANGAWADYNNDGFLDLLIYIDGRSSPSQPHGLYLNNLPNAGNKNHWLEFRLKGTVSSRDAIGAIVKVKATILGKEIWQMRQIGGQSTGQEFIAHFGLGDATKANTVRIEWPSGIVQELTDVPASQILTITEHQEYSGAPPRFNSVTPSAAGCRLSIAEPAANARYVLEASADLIAWTKLLARTSTGGTHEFLDTQAAVHPTRFYRLAVP